MKVNVEVLTDSPVSLKEDIPAADWDMGSSYLDYVDTIHLECSVYKIENVVSVTAEVEYHEKSVCARCLEEFRQDGHKQYSFHLEEADAGPELDIGLLVREEMLLEYPIRMLCSEDCKGICSTCGANLNKERCSCKKEE